MAGKPITEEEWLRRFWSREGGMMDAADELAAMILARLDVLREINRTTFNSAHPTNCGPIARWIEDLQATVTTFNLKAIRSTTVDSREQHTLPPETDRHGAPRR